MIDKTICWVVCAYCGKDLQIIKETEIIVPAEKAEKKERFYASKVNQTKLVS